MRITKSQLKQIIKEELGRVLEEEISLDPPSKREKKGQVPVSADRSFSGITQAEMDDYTADWTGKRREYLGNVVDDESARRLSAVRPQGFEKFLADVGHKYGKGAAEVDLFINKLANIPNAMADAYEVFDMAYAGGKQKTRQNYAIDIASKRFKSGDWNKKQAEDFVEEIGTMSMTSYGGEVGSDPGRMGTPAAKVPQLPETHGDYKKKEYLK
jgi:hypothetical protein